MDFYTLHLCGLTRQLPLTHISKKTQLANFSVLGDVELVDVIADRLATELSHMEFDYLVALELKIVPVVHGVAKRLEHKQFVVCRKSIKPYMVQPIAIKPQNHFPNHVKPLVIDGRDAELIRGKKVVILDTVISTGVTMRMMKKLMENVGAQVVHMIAVLRQGQQFDDFENLLFLGEIPILQKNGQ